MSVILDMQRAILRNDHRLRIDGQITWTTFGVVAIICSRGAYQYYVLLPRDAAYLRLNGEGTCWALERPCTLGIGADRDGIVPIRPRHPLAELLVKSCNVGKYPTAYVGQQ
jgi:hypothetical protein